MKLRSWLLLTVGVAPVAAAPRGVELGGGQPAQTVALEARLENPTASAAGDPEAIGGLLAEAEAEQRAMQRAGRELIDRERQCEARTVAFGRAYVRAARAGLLPVAGGFAGFVEHATRLERLRRAVERELAEQRTILQAREANNARLREVGARLVLLRANERTMARAQTALLAARDRELAFERAFAGTGTGSVVYGPGSGPADPLFAAGGFGTTRGRLPFPVAGRSVLQPAQRPGLEGPGVDVLAPAGAPVRAVFAGRVAFADDYAAYGRTVIVDHGDRYFSVSAALGEIAVQVGDELSAGARLGTVGRSGDGGSMYFELRHGAETIDASDWLGI